MKPFQVQKNCFISTISCLIVGRKGGEGAGGGG